MKIKTSVLTGPALDWAVAKCEGRGLQRNPMGAQGGHGWWIWEETPSGKGGILIDKSVYMEIGPHTQPKTRNSGERYSPSTDWAQGGLIIDNNPRIVPTYDERFDSWFAYKQSPALYGKQSFLVSAMRAYVASKLGTEIEIPNILFKG